MARKLSTIIKDLEHAAADLEILAAQAQVRRTDLTEAQRLYNTAAIVWTARERLR